MKKIYILSLKILLLSIFLLPLNVFAGTILNPVAADFKNFVIKSDGTGSGTIANQNLNYTYWQDNGGKRWYKSNVIIVGTGNQEYLSTIGVSIPSIIRNHTYNESAAVSLFAASDNSLVWSLDNINTEIQGGTPGTGGTPITGGTGEAGPNEMNGLVRLFIKVSLLVAAAMVPLIMGDKLAGAISGKIQGLTANAKKSAYARSRLGSGLAANRKDKETQALARAQGRAATGGRIRNALGNTAVGQKLGFRSEGDRARMAASAVKTHEAEAEKMSKDQRNNYLKRFARFNPNTGRMEFHDRAGFDRDYKAQAILKAQGEAGLLNDDVSDNLFYLNQMRAHKMAQGDGDFIAQTKKAGGYDYMMEEHLQQNAGAALGQLGSALRDFATPEKMAGWGSEFGDRFVQNYQNLQRIAHENPGHTYTWTDADGNQQQATAAQILRRVDGAIEQNLTPGNVEKIFSSDQTGGKALRPLRSDSNFMGLVRNIAMTRGEDSQLSQTVERIENLNRIHQTEGAVAQPTFTDSRRNPYGNQGPAPGAGGGDIVPGPGHPQGPNPGGAAPNQGQNNRRDAA